jgi:hypothetical protein
MRSETLSSPLRSIRIWTRAEQWRLRYQAATSSSLFGKHTYCIGLRGDRGSECAQGDDIPLPPSFKSSSHALATLLDQKLRERDLA